MYLRTPEAEKKLYDLAKRFEKITEDGMKAKEDFYIYKNEFSKLTHQLLGIAEPLITERNLNTFETLYELEMSEDIETDKSLMKDIFNRFSYRIPEIQAPEKFGEELNSIAEEKKLFKDSDWWLPW
jgi:formate dehydrogenase maturation protein FdhE